MTKKLILGTALAALVAGGAMAGQNTAQTVPAPQTQTAPALSVVPSALPQTQALLEGYVTANKMPGIVAAFGYHDSPTMFLSAGKIADGASAARADPDSLWRVYSMTKPITGMAAMILVEEGKLKLDQPISDFISAFKNMQVVDGPNTLASHPAKHPITVRNLLTHTAGLGYNIITTGPLLAEYNKLGINPAQVNNQFEAEGRKTRPATLEAFANKVATLPLIAEPGTKWSYSIGLDVMGRVIEVASGKPFDTFVQQRIFNPLKMKSSFWTVPRSEIGRFSTNVAFTRDAMKQLKPDAKVDLSKIPATARIPLDAAATSVWLNPPSFPYGGAGLVMSARDYDTFLHMLQNYGELGGVRIMKAETAKLAMSNLLPAGVFFPGAVAATGGTTQPMGFGAGGSVSINDTPGGVPKGTYGWGGAAGTIAFADPVRKVRGTVMVNYFPGETYPLRNEVLPAFRADVERLRK